MNFILELIIRLFGPTPKFFKVLGRIGWALGVLGTIGVTLLSDPLTPDAWTPVISKVLMYIGYITGIISQLTLTSDAKNEHLIEDK